MTLSTHASSEGIDHAISFAVRSHTKLKCADTTKDQRFVSVNGAVASRAAAPTEPVPA
jgi:hypothetical protein